MILNAKLSLCYVVTCFREHSVLTNAKQNLTKLVQVAFYAIRPGNGSGQLLGPHEACYAMFADV